MCLVGIWPFDKHIIYEHISSKNLTSNSSEHFCAWVEEVIVPLFKNESNICKFPKCLADDIKRQVRFIFRLRCQKLSTENIKGARACNDSLSDPRTHQRKDFASLPSGFAKKMGRWKKTAVFVDGDD